MAQKWIVGEVDTKTRMVKTDVEGLWVSQNHRFLELSAEERKLALQQVAEMTGTKFISYSIEAKNHSQSES